MASFRLEPSPKDVVELLMKKIGEKRNVHARTVGQEVRKYVTYVTYASPKGDLSKEGGQYARKKDLAKQTRSGI